MAGNVGAIRFELEQTIERVLKIDRSVASGIVATVRVPFLAPFLAGLNKFVPAPVSAPSPDIVVRPRAVPPPAAEDIALLPNLSKVVPSGDSVLVTVTSMWKSDSHMFTMGYGVVDDKNHLFYDTFKISFPPAMETWKKFKEDLKKSPSKQIWAKYAMKTLKSGETEMFVDSYASAERHADAQMELLAGSR